MSRIVSPDVWRCGGFELPLARTLVVGIVNVTPDSFSDGGMFATAEEAVEAGLAMIEAGADVIDVGGESSRPGSGEVPIDVELSRVESVVRHLAARGAAPVSIDTRHPEVAMAALEAGASVLNDISGFREPEMVQVAAGCGAGCVIMHMLGEPRTMQEEPSYEDVVAEVGEYLETQARVLVDAGVERERIVIDPGIGFGKTVDHNLELLRGLPDLAARGFPVLVGASRKSFIGAVLGGEPEERLDGSLAVVAHAVANGAAAVRVHDVSESAKVARMTEAIAAGYAGC